MDNLDPKFVKSFTVEYKFEERQKFKVEVYDVDDFSPNAPLAGHDYIGHLEFDLHEVVTRMDQTLKKGLFNEKEKKHNNGQVVLTADEKKDSSND
jgi:hypothetical protein